MKNLTTMSLAALLVFHAFGNIDSAASVVSSNFGQPGIAFPNDKLSVGSDEVGQMFTTGPLPSVLNSITILGRNPSSPATNYYPTLFLSVADHPGAIVENMPAYTFNEPGGSPNYPIKLMSAGTLLAPNTTYWFGLTTDRVGYWYLSSSPTQTSDVGWTVAYPGPGYVAGSNQSAITLYMQIDATLLPEPSSLMLGLLPLAATNRRRRR